MRVLSQHTAAFMDEHVVATQQLNGSVWLAFGWRSKRAGSKIRSQRASIQYGLSWPSPPAFSWVSNGWQSPENPAKVYYGYRRK